MVVHFVMQIVVEKRINNKYSLIRCHLYTGRTHQIRVHLEHVGYPILGDKIYGHSNDFYIEYLQKGLSPNMVMEWILHRQALHAYEIFFPHPNGGHKRIKYLCLLNFKMLLMVRILFGILTTVP